MAILTSTGLGSGIDINNLVTNLVNAEGDSSKALLDAKEIDVLEKVTAYGNLNGALSQFQSSLANLKTTTDFQLRNANVTNDAAADANTTFFTATATSSAVTSNYEIEVTRLASANKLRSAAFSSASENLGSGTINLTVGATTYNITIDSASTSLSNIKDAFNDVSSTTGVTASIVTVSDSDVRLQLTSNQVGSNGQITVAVTGDSVGSDIDNDGLSQLISANLTEVDQALDSIIQLDGQTITRSTNVLSDVLEGVSISLVTAEVGRTHTLSIGNDTSGANTAITSFVDNYNSLFETINNLQEFNETGDSGALLGDSTLRNIVTQVRREVNQIVGSKLGFQTLADIGITSSATTGLFAINQTDLTNALDTNFDAVGELFGTEDEGIGNRLDSLLTNLLQSKGVVDTAQTNLQTSLTNITTEREKLDNRLENLESQLLIKFNAMDALVAQLRSTGDFIANNLATNTVDPLAFKQ